MTARKRGPVPSPHVSVPHGAGGESAKNKLTVSAENNPADVELENRATGLGPLVWLALLLWLGAFGVLGLLEAFNMVRYAWR
jgi:hypothetical protein